MSILPAFALTLVIMAGFDVINAPGTGSKIANFMADHKPEVNAILHPNGKPLEEYYEKAQWMDRYPRMHDAIEALLKQGVSELSDIERDSIRKFLEQHHMDKYFTVKNYDVIADEAVKMMMLTLPAGKTQPVAIKWMQDQARKMPNLRNENKQFSADVLAKIDAKAVVALNELIFDTWWAGLGFAPFR